jgi:hypothetical protein
MPAVSDQRRLPAPSRHRTPRLEIGSSGPSSRARVRRCATRLLAGLSWWIRGCARSKCRFELPVAAFELGRWVILLRGRGSITVSSGEVREFGPGDVFLVEDTTGEGHLSTPLTEDFAFVMIPTGD